MTIAELSYNAIPSKALLWNEEFSTYILWELQLTTNPPLILSWTSTSSIQRSLTMRTSMPLLRIQLRVGSVSWLWFALFPSISMLEIVMFSIGEVGGSVSSPMSITGWFTRTPRIRSVPCSPCSVTFDLSICIPSVRVYVEALTKTVPPSGGSESNAFWISV